MQFRLETDLWPCHFGYLTKMTASDETTRSLTNRNRGWARAGVIRPDLPPLITRARILE